MSSAYTPSAPKHLHPLLSDARGVRQGQRLGRRRDARDHAGSCAGAGTSALARARARESGGQGEVLHVFFWMALFKMAEFELCNS